MSDIVERLRTTPTKRTYDSVGRAYDYPEHLPREAADEIERLRSELANARNTALEEAAKIADANAHEECEVAEQIASFIRSLKAEGESR